jgi:hypothetical protein
MSGENDCPRIGRLFGGCRFSPRYDIVGATEPFVEMITATMAQYRTQQPRKTYICDVCERCGKALFRRKDAVKKGDS